MQIPVDTERLAAIYSGQVEGVFPWIERDGRRQPSTEQERDENGVPLWTVHCMIASGDRPVLMAVRVPSHEVPQVQQFGPARFERLEAVCRVNRTSGALAVYWSAAGLVDARRGHKPAEQAA